MGNKNPLPKIDHGVDIMGDEWDEEENTDSLRAEEDWEDLKEEFNDAQMINGTFEGDSISKKKKKKNENI